MLKKIIFIVLIVGLVGFALFDFLGKDSNEEVEESTDEGTKTEDMTTELEDSTEGEDVVGIEKGNIAPDFELETLKGGKIKLSDLRGEKVMVNFWATWCPPCRAEIPDLQKLHEEQDINILAINATQSEKSIENVEDFVEELEMTFPILMDEENITPEKYNAFSLPNSFMIDTEGRIQFVALGAMNYDMMLNEYDKLN